MLNLDKGAPLSIFTEKRTLCPSECLNAEFIGECGDSTIKITVPESSDIQLWSLLTVRFVHEGISHMFCSQVIETGEDFLMLRLTSGVMRTQRRGDIRLEVLNEVTGHIEGGEIEFRGEISDISASGMSILTDTPFSKGDRLKVNLPVMQGMPAVTVDCEVRWHVILPDDSRYTCQTGCLFRFSHRIDKERLQRYILRLRHNKVHKFDK